MTPFDVEVRMRPCSRRTRTLLLSVVGGLVAAVLGGPSWAQAPAAGDLQVDRVVLSTAGVGFFQHGGRVSGDATVELRFTASQLNDLLKSLVVQDFDGGRVTSVAYPSQEPLERLLGSFAVDLSGNPSLAALFTQLRGAEARLALEGGETVAGRILGVESRMQAAGETVIEATFVSVSSSDGIRAVDLATVRRFELADAQLQAELAKALGALAEGRNTDKKAVAIRFTGQGSRRVAVGYVVEAPIWKTSYRLVLPAAGSQTRPAIQGWAIVENTTEHDWSGVELALVSGRPLSFIEDLYQPQYVARPVHRPRRFEGIGPQSYEGGMDDAMAKTMAAPPPPAAASMAMETLQMAPAEAAMAGAASARGLSDVTSSVGSVAGGEDLGATFQYTVPAVHIARQRSAMLPIITENIDATPVSIYDQEVLAGHPLLGAKLVNSTGKHLPAGPVTVLEGRGYAGDARIDDLPAGAERLLSFAVDLEVSVQRRDPGTESTLVGARIERGVLQLQQQRSRRTAYALKSEAAEARTILLTHPVDPAWSLVDTPAPAERTEAEYRFAIDLAAAATREFVIQEGRTDWEQMQIGYLDEQAMASWAGNRQLPQKVREALTRAAELRRAVVAAERAIAQPQQRMDEITAEQERIRANLASLQRGTPLHERLVDKLTEQEKALDALQQQRAKGRERLVAAQAALEEYIAGLSVR